MEQDRLPVDSRLVVVLHNPVAGRRPSDRRIEQLVNALREKGFSLHVSTNLSQATDLANREFEKGNLRCLVGAGGDGTASELANRVQPGVPVCFFPTGTSNLVASYLGMKKRIPFVVSLIETGATVCLDAGLANGRIFLAMVSCGFDAAAVEMAHRKRVAGHRQGRGGFSGFIIPICRLINTYPFPEMTVEVSDGYEGGSSGEPSSSQRTIKGRWVFAFNLPKYGWGLPIAPQANGMDGLLDLCVYGGGGFWRGLWYTVTTQVGIHERVCDFVRIWGTRFRVTSNEPVPYQIDGDPAGYLPLDIGLAPGRVRIVVPERTAEMLQKQRRQSESLSRVKNGSLVCA
ncbi:MAG TPA: diacylglycerol kinase family protein [Thermogutta sp.]|nr:diacylglycerol kinase family protein [Thermogutta sp.]